VHIDILFEHEPGTTSCTANGLKLTLTGSITNGHWSGNGAGQHELLLNNASGLVTHSALGNGTPANANGTFRDTSQTLVVNP
jgi:hypothetical protein